MSFEEQFSPGSRIGNYEVVSKLGQGGMGGVFLVRQVFLKKRYALKVLNDELAALPEFVDVFRHEAQMLATMKHPHIVQVHDFGMAGVRHYFVMDYIEGGTLEEHRRALGGKLPEAEALSVLRSVASGLAHAHALGIVHRDLKPENFLMENDGVVKITDFGLARLARAPGVAGADGTRRTGGDTYMHFADHAKDTPEMTGGTEGYMAPEVKAGGVGDARSDIYAVGIIARVLLTGRGVEVGMKPLSKLYPETGEAWDRIVNRCLSADPADRYADGAGLERDLEGLAAEIAGERKPVPPWVWVLPAPLLALSVFAALLALHAGRPHEARASAGPATATVLPPPLTLKRIREYGLNPADAVLGYGLELTAKGREIEGWRVGSRAVWHREIEPGRYRLSALYKYTPELGSKTPARIIVRIGSRNLTVFISTANTATRALLGEIEVASTSETVEFELVEGPPGEAHLGLGSLVIEPVGHRSAP